MVEKNTEKYKISKREKKIQKILLISVIIQAVLLIIGAIIVFATILSRLIN